MVTASPSSRPRLPGQHSWVSISAGELVSEPGAVSVRPWQPLLPTGCTNLLVPQFPHKDRRDSSQEQSDRREDRHQREQAGCSQRPLSFALQRFTRGASNYPYLVARRKTGVHMVLGGREAVPVPRQLTGSDQLYWSPPQDHQLQAQGCGRTVDRPWHRAAGYALPRQQGLVTTSITS